MVRKAVLLIAGILLIVLGIIGIFVPIVPQITFIVAGLALIGYANPKVKDAVEPVVKRYETRLKEFTERRLRRIRRG